MTWNYRIVFHDKQPSDGWYALHEVYYYKNGKVKAWSEKPIRFISDDGPAGIQRSLAMAMKDAVCRDVLLESELPG